jgi:hypothetical protein
MSATAPPTTRRCASRRLCSGQRRCWRRPGYPRGFSVTLTYPTNFSYDGVAFEPLAAEVINDLQAVGITARPRGEQPTVAIPDYIAGKLSMV